MNTLAITLDPQNENLNAFEAVLSYPQAWSLESITSSYQAVQYWIQTPQVIEPGKITFSGIFPGGVASGAGLNGGIPLFELNFKDTDKVSLDQVHFEDALAYVDGPSPTLSQLSHFSLTDVSASELTGSDESGDSTPPSLLDYTFETNPLTGGEQLFVNVSDDSNEPVTIEVKMGEEWVSLDGMEGLTAETAPLTVRLTDVNGNQTIVNLRPSPYEFIYLTGGIVLGIALIAVVCSMVFKKWIFKKKFRR